MVGEVDGLALPVADGLAPPVGDPVVVGVAVGQGWPTATSAPSMVVLTSTLLEWSVFTTITFESVSGTSAGDVIPTSKVSRVSVPAPESYCVLVSSWASLY